MNELLLFLKDNGIRFSAQEPMKKHTTFKTGGKADVFIQPSSAEQLSLLLRFCSEQGLSPFILGNGSNLLVSDDGIRVPVIAVGEGLDTLCLLDDTTVFAGAGTPLIRLCKFALEHCLSGLEFAYGIPGSVGGAVFMNAGAYGGEMRDVVVRAEHLTMRGEPGACEGDTLEFGYRSSIYKTTPCVITGAVFKLQKGDPQQISAKMQELLQRRKDKQPLEYPSAGSVFKRPEGYFAGALIEQSGLKGKRVGGAAVSEKHAGFIVNLGGATTGDVLALIEICKTTVKEKFGVSLETEIQMV